MNGAIVDELIDALAAAVAEQIVERLREDDCLAREPSEPWRLFDVDEVAAILGRSRRWVHGAKRNRGLPHVRIDAGKLMFDPDQVRAWALARSVPELPDSCRARAATTQPRFETRIPDRSLPPNQKADGRPGTQAVAA